MADAEATICFGVAFTSEDMLDEEREIFASEFNWEEEYGKTLDIPKPESEYNEDNAKAYEEYGCKVREAWQALGIKIVYGGYGESDASDVIVCDEESIIATCWDSPLELKQGELTPHTDNFTLEVWRHKIKAFFKLLGLRYDEGDAKLHLVAYYG
jgi:hypothetical protein